MSSIRIDKIYSILEKDISRFILTNSPDDRHLITVSHIEGNDDLSYFKVMINIYPELDIDCKSYLKPLINKINDFQLEFARRHNLKKIPIINFQMALNQEKVINIDRLIKKIQDEK